jgi:hypothetical protein
MSRDNWCSCYQLRTEGGMGRDEQEMFKVQDRMALTPVVSSWTLTLIEKDDDTRSWANFLVYFSHNAMPT